MKKLFWDKYGMTYLGGILLLITVIVILVVLFSGVMYFGNKIQCSELASINTDYKFYYSFWTGCLIENQFGYWVSISQFDYIQGNIKLIE